MGYDTPLGNEDHTMKGGCKHFVPEEYIEEKEANDEESC